MPSSEIAAGDGAGSGSDADCRTRAFITKFEMVITFDAAPVPITSSEGEVAAPAEEPAPESEESSEEG